MFLYICCHLYVLVTNTWKILLGRLNIFLRRFTGFTFGFPGLRFKFVIRGGHIMVGRTAIKLVPSKNGKYPSTQGWFTFTYGGWVYYITFAHGIRVVAVHNGKIKIGIVHGTCIFHRFPEWFRSSTNQKISYLIMMSLYWQNGWSNMVITDM